jgi:serine/threonine protein kinase
LSQNKNIKIIDFGLSNFFETGIGGLATPCGSPSYASPEIIKGEIYDGFKIDVWASGIILFAMLCGYLPFDDDEEEEKEESHDKRYFSQSNTNNKEEKSEDNEVLFQKILEGKIEFPDYLSDVAIDLIKKMLVVEPEDRIELDEIKKHKFYRMGKKNYLLYQKTITEHEVYDNINSFNYDNNTNNYNINISDNSNISNLIDKDKNIINSEMNSLDLSLIKPKKETNIIINNTNNNDESKNDKKVSNNSNIIKNEEIKSEMEEYEKKLFANYLKKVADIKKKNSDKNKTKNNKNKKENKKSIFLNIISSINNNKNFNPKNSIKNTNNYTLNEIVLNFNPINNSIESYKQVIKTPQIQKYNYNYFNNNSFEHKINNSIPLKKLKPIKLKKPEKNTFNLLSQNLNSLNTIEFASKKSNKTKNKFLKEMKYYLSEDKNIDEKKENKNTDRIPKISLSQRYQKNKPVLPAIKTNILDIGNNYNRDIFFANHRFNRHVLTETNNKSTRNKVIFNWNNSERNNFINLRNNIKNSIYKDKYKLSYPSSNKKYNMPIFI